MVVRLTSKTYIWTEGWIDGQMYKFKNGLAGSATHRNACQDITWHGKAFWYCIAWHGMRFALYGIAWHWMSCHGNALHDVAQHYMALYLKLHVMTRHCIALHGKAWHYTAWHSITTYLKLVKCIPLHHMAWHRMALHGMALDGMTLHDMSPHGMTLHGMALHDRRTWSLSNSELTFWKRETYLVYKMDEGQILF